MPSHKLRCCTCNKILVMDTADYAREVRINGPINCPVRHCPGLMTPFGPVLKRKKTIDTKQSFDFFTKRQEMRRGPRATTYRDLDDDEIEAGVINKKRRREETEEQELELRTNKKFRPDDDGEDDSDDEFVLSPDFRPEMRLNEGGFFSQRPLANACTTALITKQSDLHRITNKINGERGKSTNAQFNGEAAWKFALDRNAPNAHRYKPGKKNYYEWCHLIADSLGGQCLKDNLVAGHFALNTHMMLIEGELSGRSDLKIKVTAHCTIKHIADYIVYEIYDRHSGKLKHTEHIDGTSTGISSAVSADILKELKKNLR